METFIVTPKSRAETKILSDLLHKLNITFKVITDEEKEDIGLGMKIKEADREKKVSRAEIMKALKIHEH